MITIIIFILIVVTSFDILLLYLSNRMIITIIFKHDYNNYDFNYQRYIILYILKFHDIDNNYNDEGGRGHN